MTEVKLKDKIANIVDRLDRLDKGVNEGKKLDDDGNEIKRISVYQASKHVDSRRVYALDHIEIIDGEDLEIVAQSSLGACDGLMQLPPELKQNNRTFYPDGRSPIQCERVVDRLETFANIAEKLPAWNTLYIEEEPELAIEKYGYGEVVAANIINYMMAMVLKGASVVEESEDGESVDIIKWADAPLSELMNLIDYENQIVATNILHTEDTKRCVEIDEEGECVEEPLYYDIFTVYGLLVALAKKHGFETDIVRLNPFTEVAINEDSKTD